MSIKCLVFSCFPCVRPLELTYTQYLVMLVLWEAHSATVGEICARLRLDTGTLTPLLKKLEARGLLGRRRSAADERVVTVFLTEAGEALRAQAVNVPAQVGSCLPLSPEEAAQLYTLLYRLLDAAEA